MTTITQSTTTVDTQTATDPRAVFAGAVALAGDVIAAVRPDQLDDPTPCTEYDVRTLLGHLVTVLGRVAALGRGDNPFALPPVAVADDGWVEAWFDAAYEVQTAWSDDAVLERMMRLPWAEEPGAGMLAHYTSELTVHTWDLATATGQRPEWDERVLDVAFEASRRSLPAEDRAACFAEVARRMPAGMAPPGAPFAEAVPVAEDAPLIDRLVAWSGRRP
jgi:uncharacterized protein (TIGR03086 family)